MPSPVWISAFFSPHAFSVAVLLNYSRHSGDPFDMLTFDHVVFHIASLLVTRDNTKKNNSEFIFLTCSLPFSISSLTLLWWSVVIQVKDNSNDDGPPETGCLINGLHLNGAVWCRQSHCLLSPKDGILFDEMPTVSQWYSHICIRHSNILNSSVSLPHATHSSSKQLDLVTTDASRCCRRTICSSTQLHVPGVSNNGTSYDDEMQCQLFHEYSVALR